MLRRKFLHLSLAALLAAPVLYAPRIEAAAGDRHVRLLALEIPTPAGGNVMATVRYEYRVEDKTGLQIVVVQGSVTLDLGTWAAASALTLAQIRTQAIAKINSDGTVPPHDSAS